MALSVVFASIFPVHSPSIFITSLHLTPTVYVYLCRYVGMHKKSFQLKILKICDFYFFTTTSTSATTMVIFLFGCIIKRLKSGPPLRLLTFPHITHSLSLFFLILKMKIKQMSVSTFQAFSELISSPGLFTFARKCSSRAG